MSKLKELVPPLELCKQIPDGAFDDSALVWLQQYEGNKRHPALWAVVERESTVEGEEIYPAPTLKEILKALPSQNRDKLPLCITPDFPDDGPGEFGDAWACGYRKYGCIIETAPETAALKLWMALNEEKKNAMV